MDPTWLFHYNPCVVVLLSHQVGIISSIIHYSNNIPNTPTYVSSSFYMMKRLSNQMARLKNFIDVSH